MTAEDLLRWQQDVPDAWTKVIDIVQHAMSGYTIPLNFAQGILILLPKSESGKYRGITLLEILYKLCTMIIHLRFQQSITFHNDIHGFVHHRGTGTAILECKLEMQRARILKIPYFQIFLDLSRAYDSIDRKRLLDILCEIGVGPNTRRFLRRNWSRSILVPRIGGYYGRPISSRRGIWQGDVLSPDEFDIVVDTVFREWHRIVGDLATGKSYADDIRLADTDWHRLQRNLDILLGLFARVGLLPNATKTKAMVSIGRSSGRLSDCAYKRRYDCSLPTYRARKRAKVQCTYCNIAVNCQYLPTHLREIHHVLPPREVNEYFMPSYCLPSPPRKRRRISTTSDTNAIPSSACTDIVYRINLTDGPVSCPIPACPAILSTKQLTCVHFCSRHPEIDIEFTATGMLHRCSRCGLFLNTVSATHHASAFCKRYSRRRLDFEHERLQCEALNAKFYIGAKEIEIVRNYRYLGRIISDDDSDDLAIFSQLHKSRTRWGRLGTLLRSDGADPATMGKFWKTIVQAVLLFGSETWAFSLRSLRRLDRFQARCARYMAKQHIRRCPDNSWDHPTTATVLDDCKMFSMAHYIKKRRSTLIKHYAAEHSDLYRECLGLETNGNVHNLLWWNLEQS